MRKKLFKMGLFKSLFMLVLLEDWVVNEQLLEGKFRKVKCLFNYFEFNIVGFFIMVLNIPRKTEVK